MKNISFKIFVDCEEACGICDKSQYCEASLWQKFKLNMHFLYCLRCKKHSRKNGKLTKLCKEARLKCLNAEDKEKMKEMIASEILKQ